MTQGSPSKVVSSERWEALRREYRQRTAASRARLDGRSTQDDSQSESTRGGAES